jgi:signal transduction histidine kinase/CheY-like chemotaxis protein/HPt (histidine-containing phosphotransfer) domain-containing protein
MKTWFTQLTLRAKITGIALWITTISLAVLATSSILQMRYEIAVEERRAADAVSLSFSRSAQLEMTVGDKRGLNQLTAGFAQDPSVMFIAAYDANKTLLSSAAASPAIWKAFLNGTLDPGSCVISQRTVQAPDQQDDFTSPTDDAAAPAASGQPSNVGTVVVGLSTTEERAAQRRQDCVTLAVAAVAAIGGGVFLFVALGKWLARLQKLAEASKAISAGNFAGEINDHGNDEISQLGKSFDDMSDALHKREAELRQFTETLQEQVKERTRDLQTALTAAEEANKAKSLFLANMSHELRTPLNGVIGMVDLLLAAEPNQRQRRYCDIAKSSARSLVELINDILDFSKIEAGKLDLDSTDFDLHEAVEAIPQILGERAQQKGVELLCRVHPAVPRIVGGDPVRLRQVVLNLVSNAVKFTDKGEVIIDARVESETDEYTEVYVSVKDSGIGIPKDRLDRLFKSFSQVDTSTTRKYGGTGLGLAISQRLVKMMNGTIGVNSEEGKGSTFWFTVKLARRSQAAVLRKESCADPRGLRILAVDDNQTNREILQSQLSSWSLRADIAEDAQQALDMLRKANIHGDPYRFAILDMHMPRTDGMQLATSIKSDPATRDVILISLSSISDQIKREQMGEHGFAACLTKPVLPSQLYDTIVNSLAATESDAAAAVTAPKTGARLDGVHVLLAEDNEVNRLVATELLQLTGCQVSVAVNGQDAVEKALGGSFDVMLMDCQMPILDGFQATRAIRRAELDAGKGEHRKIIALTANAIKGDRELCLSAGMDEYLTKPIEPDDLLKTIQKLLSPERAAHVTMANPAPTNPAPANPSPTVPAPTDLAPATPPATTPQPETAAGPSPIDLESLTRRCINNRKLAAKALRLFDGGLDRDLESLTKSVQERNPKAIAASAHKIKGAAANVSAEDVRRIAAELEKLGRADALAESESMLQSLTQQVSAFRSYLESALAQLNPAEKTGEPAAANTKPVQTDMP